MKAFWMVLIDGTSGVTVRHDTESSAKFESRRLAAMHPGKKVYVLKCIGHAILTDPVMWESAHE